MDKAARAEAQIKKTCDRLGISSAGRQWLDVALDPFKDITQRPIGYPDSITAPSVVQVVHDSITIAKPAGVSGNWDCNIFLDTLWKQQSIRETIETPVGMYALSTQQSTNYTRGGLVVRGAAAGTALNTPTTYMGESYVTDVFADDTSSRIIGIGLEVHNTTAELNKQGSVITYRAFDEPAQYPVTVYSSGNVVTNNQTPMGYELVEPPYTAGEAIDLPGSLQWDAAKGCYIVPRFMNATNEPCDLRLMAPISKETPYAKTYFPTILQSGGLGPIISINGGQYDSNNAHIPFSLSGAYFTGLSPETTLVANLTYYVEQLPSVESSLRRLATPSCPEDFAALELYTKISRHMPTGVEVNDNFLGAFVAGIARVASMVAPYVPRIINAITGAAEVVDTVTRHVNQDREIRQPNHERAIVPYVAPKRSEIVVRDNNNGSREIIVAQNNNGVQASKRPVVQQQPRNRKTAGITVRNQRSKDYSRMAKYIKASEAGNRYII